MEPWFAPAQIYTALGITLPIFIYYAWRIYSMILEHGQAFKNLKEGAWLDEILLEGWNKSEMAAQLALNSVFLRFDNTLGFIRRSLRADVYIIILLGFIGTLIGMITAFADLLLSIGDKGMDPATALTALLRGGLSTALISSLIAAVLACLVMGYLSFTEKRVVKLKEEVNADCFERYRLSQIITEEVAYVES